MFILEATAVAYYYIRMQDMWDQEKKHLDVMNKLQIQYRVRPTILSDVARAGGFILGAATALMSKEAAMACTEAVETVIGEHYDEYALCSQSVYVFSLLTLTLFEVN